MSKVVVTEFLTLDGVVGAPGGEFHPDGKGAWTFPFFEEEAGTFADRLQDLPAAGDRDLVHELMRDDAIDEFRLTIFPVVHGSDSTPLRLADVTTLGAGVVVLT